MKLTNVPIIEVYEEDLEHDMYSDKLFVILGDNKVEMFDRF
jgi:hypothetical protein